MCVLYVCVRWVEMKNSAYRQKSFRRAVGGSESFYERRRRVVVFRTWWWWRRRRRERRRGLNSSSSWEPLFHAVEYPGARTKVRAETEAHSGSLSEVYVEWHTYRDSWLLLLLSHHIYPLTTTWYSLVSSPIFEDKQHSIIWRKEVHSSRGERTNCIQHA